MHAVSGSISLPSQGFFSPFPHGTGSLSVSQVFSLGRMVPHIQTRFHVPRPTRHHYVCPFVYGNITLYVRTSQSVPLNTHKLNGLIPVRSPLLRESQLISFPKGTEMFHFPRSLQSLCIQFNLRRRYPPYSGWVPFRNLRIKDICRLPELSQAITSFIASDCQGIHHMH